MEQQIAHQRPDLMEWDMEHGAVSFGGQTLSVPPGSHFHWSGTEFYALRLEEYQAATLYALVKQVAESPFVTVPDVVRTRLRSVLAYMDQMPHAPAYLTHYEAPIQQALPPLDDL